MADLYPQFILSGSIGLQASGGRDLFSSASSTGLANAGVVWNVLNYGRIKNNVRAQDAAYQALIANYQNTVLTAYSEVESAMVAYAQSRKQVGFYENSVAASRKAAEIAVDQYRDGIADYSRILNTQTALLRSQANLIEARQQVSSNLVAVYKGLGGGWQIRQNQEFLPETVSGRDGLSHRLGRSAATNTDPRQPELRTISSSPRSPPDIRMFTSYRMRGAAKPPGLAR